VSVSDVPLFEEIRAKLKAHIWFDDPRYYPFVVAWIAGTHIHDSFSMYPYFYVTGVKGSGKTTRLGESVRRLSRDGIMAGSITKSSLFRTVDAKHPTLILDEQQDMSPEMKDILKTGNEYTGKAIVNVQTDGGWTPTEFSTYCPKVIINTSSLDVFLLDRSIQVDIVKKKNNGSTPIPKGDWNGLRDKLSMHMIEVENRLKVENDYVSIMKSAGERKDEYWAPIISIARLFHVESEIKSLRDSSEKAKELDDDSPERTILVVLQKMVKLKEHYKCKEILIAISKYDSDYSGWNEKKLGRQLRRMFKPLQSKDTGTGVAYWFDPNTIRQKMEDNGYSITSETSETSLDVALKDV
jgi:hypothetical protein